MAYISSNLYLLSTSPSGVNRWQYSTTDLIATVTGAGYLADGALRGMKPGDFIDVVIFTTYDATDGQFSGFSSYNLCYAASISGVTATAAAIQTGGSSTITANSTATSGYSNGDIVISGAGDKVSKLTLGSGVAAALSHDTNGVGGVALTNWAATTFSTAIPLTGPAFSMPRQIVDGALAFSVSGSPVAGGACYVRLIADGVNTPSFSGFTESGSSSGYVNTQGIDNQVTFWYDGLTAWYQVVQALSASPQPVPYFSSASIAGASPNTINITLSAALNTGQVPATSAFAVSASGGAASVSNVSLAGAVVSLTLDRTIGGGETVSVSYTAPVINYMIDSTSTFPAQNFTGKSVTNTAGYKALRFTALSAVTETVDATFGYDYTSTSSGPFGSAYGKSAIGLPTSADGYITAVLGAKSTYSGTFSPFIGLSTSSTNGAASTCKYGIYGDTTAYNLFLNGSGGVAADTAVTPTVSDILKIERTATTVVASVSQDGGSTFTTLKTWTGDAGTKYYGACDMPQASEFKKITVSANWA